MTGYFIPVMRDGSHQSVEVDQLTEQEMANWVMRMEDGEAEKWLIEILRWIKQNVKKRPCLSSGEEVINGGEF